MHSLPALLLLSGAFLSASGYGATFLLSAYCRSLGGSDLDAGLTLGAAMMGTFAGVPLVGWYSARFDAACLSAIGSSLIACGFFLLALASAVDPTTLLCSGGLIGLGWGMFYTGAPMSISERVPNVERTAWFMRFGAFQMAGIGGGPVLHDLMSYLGLPLGGTTFMVVGFGCLLASCSLWMYARLARASRLSSKMRPWVRPIITLSRGPTLRPILMVGLGACVFTGLMTFQSTLMAGTGVSPTKFYVVYLLTVVLARLLLAGSMSRLPQRGLRISLVALMSAGVATMLLVQIHPNLQVAAAVLIGIGYGLAYSVIQNWLLDMALTSYHHAALTWFVLAYFAGIFGFPILGGWVLIHFGVASFLCVLLVVSFAELFLAAGRQPVRE